MHGSRGDVDSLTWLGQAGFLLEVAGLRVLIDPFVSAHRARLYPPPYAAPLAEGIDWLLVTHEHLDHLDVGFLPLLATHSPTAIVVLPTPIVDQAVGVHPGVRAQGVRPDDRIDLSADVHLRVLPAWHGVEPADAYTEGLDEEGRARFIGFLLTTPTATIYHSGDTLVTDELREALVGEQIDIALLPVNGRDYYRERSGLVGNMDAREAVKLARELRAQFLVPMHWDLFSGNTVSPGAVADLAAGDSGLHILIPSRFSPLPLPIFRTR
jgi:L-ascorbate 6-phosphate lactonase